jgi:dipeptidyl-peptidase-4
MTSPLTIQEVAKYPRPGTEGPRRFEFTPDSTSLLYLDSPPGSLVQQLWACDLASGQRRQLSEIGGPHPAPISREEELRRERTRTRELGITDFQVAPQAETLTILVSLGGWLYLKQGERHFRKLDGTEGALNARLSPDGQRVAFVRQNNLYVLELSGEAGPQALTADTAEGITNGLAEYIAQEEMHRLEGFWWSPDSRRIAFERVDNRHIPIYPILHQGQSAGTGEIEEHRYPFTGEANDKVELGVIYLPAPGAGKAAPATYWLNLNLRRSGAERPAPLEDGYLARVAWQPEGQVIAQLESRDQQSLKLVTYDPEEGSFQVMLEEQNRPWINLHDLTYFLKSGETLLGSERTGFRHLYLFNHGETRPLTSGDWLVTDVNRVDEQNRAVYFTATKDSPLERHLYRVSLDGGEIARLTGEAGWHITEVSPDGTWVVDRFSSLENPVRVTLNRITNGRTLEKVATLYEDSSVSPAALGLKPPELVNFPAEDGTLLYGAIYHPANAAAAQPFPLIVSVYGGPSAQRVQNNWDLTVDMRAQYLAQQGFIVFRVDNRGSASRGLAFEGVLYKRFGEIELQDQITGVTFLTDRGLADPERVGIFGWSYGGYMTLIALLKAPGIFKVGVSGAPVTFFEAYDTHYTERYLSTPQSNPEGYRLTSVLPLVGNLQGKLFLVHGLVDENVHFRNSAALIERLAEENKRFDLLVFPEERHMPRKPANLLYLEQRVTDYFKENL